MSSVIHQLIEGAFKTFGYTILPTWRIQSAAYVTLLSNILCKNNIDCVIDVGANSGQFASLMRDRVRYKGKIISFEPNDHVYETLMMKAKCDQLWTIYNVALGSESGSKPLSVMAKDTFSSFYTPTHDFTDQFSAVNKVNRTIEVEVNRLDEFDNSGRLHDAKNLFLKVDTQGHDLEVLRGAAGIIDKIAAVQIEIPIIKIYEHTPNIGVVMEFLQDLGFDVCGMFPVSTDVSHRVIEFDGVFINRNKFP